MQTVILIPGLVADDAMWGAQQRDALAATRAVHITDVHFRFDMLAAMAA